MEKLGKYGHHPDDLIDAQVEIDRLEGLLTEAMAALVRASDYQAVTPNGISIRHTVLNALSNLGKSFPTESRGFQPQDRGMNEQSLRGVGLPGSGGGA